MAFQIDDSLTAAIAEVRNDESPSNFAVAAFDADGKTLGLLDNGTGDFAACVNALKEDDFSYALFRTKLVIDSSETTKFVYLQLSPDNCPPMRRARLGTFAGRVADEVFHPYHVDLKESEKGDFKESEAILKIEVAAGVRDHVLSAEEAATRQKRTYTGKEDSLQKLKGRTGFIGGATAGGGSPLTVDEEPIKLAIAEVRDDGNPTDWCVVGYKGQTELVLRSKGSGGLDELLAALADGEANYALFRTSERIDRSDTVKFAFVNWQPETIPMFQRAKIVTHKGVVEETFAPYHLDFKISERSELTNDAVSQRLAEISGKGRKDQNVRSDAATPRATARTLAAGMKKATLGGATAEGAVVGVQDSDAIRDAIAAVRSDSEPTDWAIVGYESSKAKQFRLVSSGAGGCGAMLESMEQDSINYAILRVSDTIDKSVTTKFVFVHFQGPGVSPMMKGRVSTHKGSVKDLFGAWHVDFFIEDTADLTQDMVVEKVGLASGSISRVK